jgi:hypothetical protein
MFLRGGPGGKLSRSRPSPSARDNETMIIDLRFRGGEEAIKAMCVCRAVRAIAQKRRDGEEGKQ